MEIAAIADINENLLATHAKNMKVGYCTTDYRKLLDDSDIDIIVIGTKQNLHAKLIVESLDAGKWVFCEKPMAETEDESRAVINAEKRSPGKLAIGFNRRFAPSYRRAKQLMHNIPKPWLINYRLMFPNPQKKNEKNFYSEHERILYEGSHILDYVSWLLCDRPKRVFMTGDRILNNCCILEYRDGSQFSFMCGSFGSYCLWKEYIEIFGKYTAITVSDFVDMRVRGFPGESDSLYPLHLGERAGEIRKWGFDFYETYRAKEAKEDYSSEYVEEFGMCLEPVKRPLENIPFDVNEYNRHEKGLWASVPDKGWTDSFKDFAACFIEGRVPENADGNAGKLSTDIALALLESLEKQKAITM